MSTGRPSRRISIEKPMKEKLVDGCVVGVVVIALFWAIAEPQETRAVNDHEKIPTPHEAVKAVEMWSNAKLSAVLNAQQQAAETLKDHADRLEQIESVLQQATTEESESAAEELERTVVRLYTADESWSCGPCKTQQEQLQTATPSFEFETIKGPREGRPPGRNVYPTWEIVRADGTTTVLHGAKSVAQLETWVNDHK